MSGKKILSYVYKNITLAYSCMCLVVTGVYLHDPTALIAAVNPSLFTYTEGVVRVQTCGITRGMTIFDNTKKRSVVCFIKTSQLHLGTCRG